jgi:hypothetical protein
MDFNERASQSVSNAERADIRAREQAWHASIEARRQAMAAILAERYSRSVMCAVRLHRERQGYFGV